MNRWIFGKLALGSAALFVGFSLTLPTGDDLLEGVMMDFGKGHVEYGHALVLPYQQNLPSDISLSEVKEAQSFYADIKTRLLNLDTTNLNPAEYVEYRIMGYECQLSLDRLALTESWLAAHATVTDAGLYAQHEGPAWYAHLLKAWTSTEYSPAAVKSLGYQLADVFAEGRQANEHALLPSHFTEKEMDIVKRYARLDQTIGPRLSAIFPDFEGLSALDFRPVASERMGQVPGYYRNSTLYYNTFQTSYDLRQSDWLYLHEGNPGHHFQLQYEATRWVPEYREGMAYGGFREGWAAYVEDIEMGQQLGVYRDAAARYGMYEWNLIRAVRLVLDVGLNYEGWTDADAMQVWNIYLSDLPEVGQREIDRMRRWPCQVVTYLVGAHVIQQVKARERERLGDSFDLKAFHTRLLSQRSIPVALIPLLFEGD